MRRIIVFGLSGFTIFFYITFTFQNDFRKKILNIKCVFLFSLQHLYETLLISRIIIIIIIIIIHSFYSYVQHRALTKLLHLTLFLATACTSCHLFP